MNTLSPTTLLIQDLITAPTKAETILETLTEEQITIIENTIDRVKRRKLTKSHSMPSPVASPPTLSEEDAEGDVDMMVTDNSRSATTAIANALAAAMVSAALQVPASAAPTVSNKNTQNISNPSPNASPATIAAKNTSTNAKASMTSSKHVNQNNSANASVSTNEPTAEIKDGIEWVSFVYSHNRTLKRYSIRTDIHSINVDEVDDKFKIENCVYPRANLPKETYKGNRWAYETECNDLGWKLAYLNKEEIAGKRGLIQRAVDSYRNRYPSMRSRRVARQEKLLNGTLRKRKNRDDDDESITTTNSSNNNNHHNASHIAAANSAHQPLTSTSLEAATVKPANHPKTIALEDLNSNTRYRIKINVETVSLDDISEEFRSQNCPYPRARTTEPDHYVGGRTRWMEHTVCNELSWKLAFLNQRVLAGKKNLLQRALDAYRNKFMPALKPRKHSFKTLPTRFITTPTTTIDQSELFMLQPPPSSAATILPTPLTASALDAQNALFEKKRLSNDEAVTSLDFGDCFSLDDEAQQQQSSSNTQIKSVKIKLTNNKDTMTNERDPMISPSYDPMCSDARFSPFNESIGCHTSSTSSAANTPSPPVTADLFGFTDNDLYESFMLPPLSDTFMLLDTTTNGASAATTPGDVNMKKYDPATSSPLPPSAAVCPEFKLENDFQTDFSSAAHLLDPLF